MPIIDPKLTAGLERTAYYVAVAQAMLANPRLRYGQALFNVLADMRPDLSQAVRSDDSIDPFYADADSDRIKAFYAWLNENW